MKTLSIDVSLRRPDDPECIAMPVVAVHGPTKSRGYGLTVEDAISDLFTTHRASDAARRCELPIGAKP